MKRGGMKERGGGQTEGTTPLDASVVLQIWLFSTRFLLAIKVGRRANNNPAGAEWGRHTHVLEWSSARRAGVS